MGQQHDWAGLCRCRFAGLVDLEGFLDLSASKYALVISRGILSRWKLPVGQ